jgi:hypothetical protein
LEVDSKQRWNSAHYCQVNVAVPKELAAQFKASCEAKGVSVAGEIARLMREDLGVAAARKKERSPAPRFDTRLDRRKAIKNIVWQLEEVKAAEEAYRGSIPEQLQESNGEGIDEAICSLENIVSELVAIEIYPEPPVRRKIIKQRGG